MRDHFRMMAACDAWANRRLHAACMAPGDEARRADPGAAFRSLRGTLNRLLVARRLRMRRFTGEGEAPAALDLIHFRRESGRGMAT